MRKTALIPALSVSAILCAVPVADALDIFGWKPFGSKKSGASGAAAGANESAAQQELRQGEALETSGKLDAALKVFRGIVKSDALTAAAQIGRAHV